MHILNGQENKLYAPNVIIDLATGHIGCPQIWPTLATCVVLSSPSLLMLVIVQYQLSELLNCYTYDSITITYYNYILHCYSVILRVSDRSNIFFISLASLSVLMANTCLIVPLWPEIHLAT